MSEQQQVQPKRTEEPTLDSVQMSGQTMLDQAQEEIFNDNIDINDLLKDISDIVQESMDIAKAFRQKGGQ